MANDANYSPATLKLIRLAQAMVLKHGKTGDPSSEALRTHLVGPMGQSCFLFEEENRNFAEGLQFQRERRQDQRVKS